MSKSVVSLVIRRCRFVNVVTQEIYPADIEISGDRVARICPPGQGRGKKVLEARGLYATPGLMDAHLHTESTLLTLPQFAATVLPAGTTTVFINPHEIANVLGLSGVRWLLGEAERLPLRVFLIAPCKVPTAPGLETSGASFGTREMREMANWPGVLAMGEFNGDRLLAGDPRQTRLLRLARRFGKIPAGHAPAILGADLVRLVRMGVRDDHESTTFKEVQERCRVGMTSFLREGSAERSLKDIIPALIRSGMGTNGLCFCTDDKHPDDLLKEGGISHCVREAVALGLPPLQALRMASWNCARHYGLASELGGLLPGQKADLLLMPSLHSIRPRYILVGGRVVHGPGTPFVPPAPAPPPRGCLRSLSLPRQVPPDALRVPPLHPERRRATVRVIQVFPDSPLNREIRLRLPIRDGAVLPDPAQDVLKVSVMDRYTGRGRCASAFVRGFGMKEGALVSSVAHDHHNLIGVGVRDGEILFGFRVLERAGGGLCVVQGERAIALLPLPLAGLLSDRPLEEVVRGLRKVNRAARGLGCPLPSPFMTLSLLSLPTLPELGLSDRGLIRAAGQRRVPVVLG